MLRTTTSESTQLNLRLIDSFLNLFLTKTIKHGCSKQKNLYLVHKLLTEILVKRKTGGFIVQNLLGVSENSYFLLD
jgi:hypothetical protein